MANSESAGSEQDKGISRTAERLRALLDAGHRLSKHEAGKRLGRHPRTITRLVATLRNTGVPVKEERSPSNSRAKRFFLEPGDQRRSLYLQRIEESALLALTVAAEAARATFAGTPLEQPLDQGLNMLLKSISGLEVAGELLDFEPQEEAGFWHFGSLRTQAPDPEVFATLRRAMQAQQRVRMDYINGKGDRSFGREIAPLALAPVRGVWLVAAYCYLRRDVRDFSLTRISNVRLVKRFLSHPLDFDANEHFVNRFSALSGGRPMRVLLSVSSECATYFRSRRYHDSQIIDSEGDDGSIVVSYHVPSGAGLDEVRAFVSSWGPNVIALEPPQLVARLAEDAEAVARTYAPAQISATLR